MLRVVVLSTVGHRSQRAIVSPGIRAVSLKPAPAEHSSSRQEAPRKTVLLSISVADTLSISIVSLFFSNINCSLAEHLRASVKSGSLLRKLVRLIVDAELSEYPLLRQSL